MNWELPDVRGGINPISARVRSAKTRALCASDFRIIIKRIITRYVMTSSSAMGMVSMKNKNTRGSTPSNNEKSAEAVGQRDWPTENRMSTTYLLYMLHNITGNKNKKYTSITCVTFLKVCFILRL